MTSEERIIALIEERDTAQRERDEAQKRVARIKRNNELLSGEAADLLHRATAAEAQLAESALREETLREALRTITRHAGHLVDVNADMVHDGATSWKPCFSYCPTCVARHALATPTAGTPLVDAVRALVVATIPISKWLDQRHMMYDWERPAFGKMRNDLDTACAALEAAWPGVKGA